jgi:hypothetical protein
VAFWFSGFLAFEWDDGNGRIGVPWIQPAHRSLHTPPPILVSSFLLPAERVVLTGATAKALELFMISLVTKSANEARERSSKRVTAAHLKQAVLKDQQFDFLSEIVSKVADAPAPRESADGGADGEGRKRRAGGGRRKKKDSSDDDMM